MLTVFDWSIQHVQSTQNGAFIVRRTCAVHRHAITARIIFFGLKKPIYGLKKTIYGSDLASSEQWVYFWLHDPLLTNQCTRIYECRI